MDPQEDNLLDAPASQRGSRATSPGGYWRSINNTRVIEVSGLSMEHNSQDGEPSANSGGEWVGKKPSRYRPRTFPYQRYLPYRHPDREQQSLADITSRLYIAVSAGDFVPGATHWTRELRGWIQLKFDMPRETRIKLCKLYYELALAPGMDRSASERFSSMFMTLTKRKHYLKAGEDLYLDWRPIFKEFKQMVLPSNASPIIAAQGNHAKTSMRTLIRLSTFAQVYFDPRETPAIFKEVLPYFSMSSPENAYAAVAILNLLLPTGAPPSDSKWQPQHYMPTLFHLWSLMNRSKTFDQHILDLMSRLARDCLLSESVPFSENGIFFSDQSSLLITAALRLLEIPVSQVTSPYSSATDSLQGMSALLDRDQKKHPIAHHIARWIVMSLSPDSSSENSMLAKLEGLIQAIETFYHPSNSGHWTRNLSQLVFHLADFFVMRWNRERSGEMAVPKERHLNEHVRRRFVLCLRDVTFLGIFAKSGTAITYSLSTLQSLAFLEPTLILPGALQRIYPAMRGLVEVHRTTSSIRALFELTRIIARTKGFRCHLTSLLGLALPGIDANDLDKTSHTLNFMQAVFYDMPVCALAPPQGADADSMLDGMLAAEWVTGQIERLEAETVDVEIDYGKELSDEDEAAILRSSTAEFGRFISSFMDSLFNMLRNLPDGNRTKNTGTPEETITNALPAAFSPMVSAMSPELFELALDKMCDFVSQNTVYQARDAIAYMVSAVCKVDPHKTLSRILPILFQNIRTEIEENGAGSSRTLGSDVLPKDKALIYNLSILSMATVHVGSAIMDFAKDLQSMLHFLRGHCKGVASTHASNIVHHVLLTLTMTYTMDQSLYEESDLKDGKVTADLWAVRPDPQRLNIKWHYADEREIDFAVHLFKEFAEAEMNRVDAMLSDTPPVRRDGSGKNWSDELSQSLVLCRLMLAGVAPLFDPRHDIGVAPDTIASVNGGGEDDDMPDADGEEQEDTSMYGATEDDEVRPTFQYPTGYHLRPGDENYKTVHSLRERIGMLLHKTHDFLRTKQQDDVTAFNALYSTYKAWFVDVGFERSAHVLDRVTRLLAADIGPFKFSGRRKEYPRPLLVRRAYVYHLQRLRHNASPRHKTELDLQLLKDLVESCVSSYTETRKTAQTAIESSMKVLIGVRPSIIPPLLAHFEQAINETDYARIKGCMYALLFGSLAKPVGRDWRYAPTLLRLFLGVMDVDKLSIQKIATAASIQIMEITRQIISRITILDNSIVSLLAPPGDDNKIEKQIAKKSAAIRKRYEFIKAKKVALAEDFVGLCESLHWRKESRTATLIIGLGLRFEDMSSDNLIELIVKRSINSHPNLRAIYQSALIGLYSYVDLRAVADHNYENYLTDTQKLPSMVQVEPRHDDDQWTKDFLTQFTQADAEVFQDQDHPGWLVWEGGIPSFKASMSGTLEYDETEMRVRRKIGGLLDVEWFSKIFQYLKQEPRDVTADRFRLTNTIGLAYSFGLMYAGLTAATFEDIKKLVSATFEDGSDKHQHRATAEIMAGLLNAALPLDASKRNEVWEYAFPMVRTVFEDGITPENMSYWQTFLDVVIQNKDPRRCWPMLEWLSSFRLDMSSSAAFKESSKITLLMHGIVGLGWRFRLAEPARQDFLAHLDHPYKGVRDVMGQTLASIQRAEYHESFKDLDTFVDANAAAGSIGLRPYELTKEFEQSVRDVFARLEKWRQERPAGQQTASSYTSGGKTILAWLEMSLNSFECTQLVPFFPDVFLEALLHMMDVKEDQELQSHAYAVFRHLGNVPFRPGEEGPLVDACIRVGRSSSSWHQRLRVMINMQAIYFRQLFVMGEARQRGLFTAVTEMLEDAQLEVRVGAGATLSGMVRCSPVKLRNAVIPELVERFSKMLARNPVPGRGSSKSAGDASKTAILRHAAVLGLGGLVQAFPYTSPPPAWTAGVLTTLATRAAGDAGMVGKSAKGIVSDFKKTRQDTWHLDVKAFQPEQLEDLEGVLWKSYFA